MAGSKLDNSKGQKLEKKGKERKDYTFWRLLDEKPGKIPGCPNRASQHLGNFRLSEFVVQTIRLGYGHIRL